MDIKKIKEILKVHHSYYCKNAVLNVPTKEECFCAAYERSELEAIQLLALFEAESKKLIEKAKEGMTNNRKYQQQIWQEKQTSLGNCITCGKKAVTKHHCEYHRVKVNEYLKRHRASLKGEKGSKYYPCGKCEIDMPYCVHGEKGDTK